MIADKLNILPNIEYRESDINELKRNIADTSKIQDLGFKFNESLEGFIENELIQKD